MRVGNAELSPDRVKFGYEEAELSLPEPTPDWTATTTAQ